MQKATLANMNQIISMLRNGKYTYKEIGNAVFGDYGTHSRVVEKYMQILKRCYGNSFKYEYSEGSYHVKKFWLESDKPFNEVYVPEPRRKQAPKRKLVFHKKVMTVQEIKDYVMLDEIYGNKYSTPELVEIARSQGVKVIDTRERPSIMDCYYRSNFLNLREHLVGDIWSTYKAGSLRI
jgi:hypothetical protein